MIEIGKKVNHQIFGEGVITDVLIDQCVIAVRMKCKEIENETAWITWEQLIEKGFALEGTEEYKKNNNFQLSGELNCNYCEEPLQGGALLKKFFLKRQATWGRASRCHPSGI